MNIFLTGVETNNKGAELMLYAILQEIERTYPDSHVFINSERVSQGAAYVNTTLKFSLWNSRINRFLNMFKINGIVRRLGFPGFYFLDGLPHIDYLLDGSGLHFTDNLTIIAWWESLLKSFQKNGAKIVFLPQGFGPIEKGKTKKAIKAVSKYSELIYAREDVSYEYLSKSALVDMKKVRMRTDFTSLVNGVLPSHYSHLKDGICIIPNCKMVTTGMLSFDEYLKIISEIAKIAASSQKKVYLLNHEGKEDEKFAYRCQKEININIEVVTGLNAIETKGLISSAYSVISSRFHGVASSLNCCVPCLATSWSHKYSCIFEDYKQKDCILPLHDNDKLKAKIQSILDPDTNMRIRKELAEVKPYIQQQARDMWKEIWNLNNQ